LGFLCLEKNFVCKYSICFCKKLQKGSLLFGKKKKLRQKGKKAKGERRKAKGERRKAKGERKKRPEKSGRQNLELVESTYKVLSLERLKCCQKILAIFVVNIYLDWFA